MIKSIIFDLGNVIVPFDFLPAFKKLVDISDASFEDVCAYFGGEDERLYTEGKITTDEFFRSVKKHFGLSILFEDFTFLYNDIFTLNEGVVNIIKRLTKNYPLYLLSNTNELHFEFILKNYPVMKLFEEFVLSYKEHCQKPDSVIFERAIARTGCMPEEIIFIDDIEENIVAAKRMGLNGIHFTQAEELRSRLRQLA